MPRLSIIVGSNRPGSNGLPVGSWLLRRASEREPFGEVGLVDLAEVGLPFLDEPEHPSTGRYRHQHTRNWSALIDASDAFLIVLPMYNGGYGAALKNALDFLYAEWRDKPVALVSYSAGASGGAPAAEALRPVLERLGMRLTGEPVALPGIEELVDKETGFRPTPGIAAALDGLLDEVTTVAVAGSGRR
ncbi:NADPH-dependent FMN reductase [Streptomyces triticirhizae]|uniref:NADPH-dependent oxidoreductase n=1 Tax=Streptomyces triticirhizae TaxID=2483353 RepID=A0A3M2M948_9ACTN|nr:NAD(P)H-dependent oxidoreductase [Streptomyces triticirhizae]RMI46009.1 NADPH-dependent oxidoreductase [Streptomyces triticirhizae]